eukprot:11082960-Alexandrium_andersonii.AAC.1
MQPCDCAQVVHACNRAFAQRQRWLRSRQFPLHSIQTPSAQHGAHRELCPRANASGLPATATK